MLAVLCRSYQPEREIVSVGQPFSVPLIDPDTGELLERDLVGTWDLRERDAEGFVVVDLKTSGEVLGSPGRGITAAFDLQLCCRAEPTRGRP